MLSDLVSKLALCWRLKALSSPLQAAGDHVAVVGAAGGVGQILTAKLLEVRAGVSRPYGAS